MKLVKMLSIAVALPTLFFASMVQAQTDLLSQLGAPAGTTMYQIPGVQGAFVNLQNGDVHISIPIETIKQRNGTNLAVSLVYDSEFYYIYSDVGFYQWAYLSGGNTPLQNVSTVLGAGWNYVVSPSASNQNIAFSDVVSECISGEEAPEETWSNWQYIDNTGTAHIFSSVETMRAGYVYCADQSAAYGEADDGSGYYMSVTNYNNATVYDQNGNVVYSNYVDPINYLNDTIRWTDTNGNMISYNISNTAALTDELGRTVTLPANFSVQSNTIQVGTAFDTGGTAEYSGSMEVLTGITLPSGQTYSFGYDGGGAGHSGAMTSMTLPTGGTVNFVPQMMPSEDSFGYVPPSQITTPDGTWNFSWTTNQSAPINTVVTAPLDPHNGQSSQTVYTYTCNQAAPPACSSTLSTYAGTASGAPLKSVTQAFDVYQRPTTVTTILDNGFSQTSNYIYYGMPYPSSTSAGQNGYTYATNIVSTRQDYDYSGSLVREIKATYGLPSQYTDLHIGRPTQVSLYGPGEALAAQTNYGYDGTLSSGSGSKGSPVTGLLSGHDDADYGSTMTIRGNVTSMTQMVSGGGSITTQTNSYNILGEVVQTSDALGNTTNYDYSDNFNPACPSGIAVPTTSTFGYQTLATNPLGQETVTGYQSCDGAVTSVQDPNDLSAGRAGTLYSYDASQRQILTQYPDGAALQSITEEPLCPRS